MARPNPATLMLPDAEFESREPSTSTLPMDLTVLEKKTTVIFAAGAVVFRAARSKAPASRVYFTLTGKISTESRTSSPRP